jgi:hypothetical protein
MRKVLSFVLVLSLVLGSFGMAFAAPLSDIAGEDFEDAVNVLTELGVVKGYPDGTYKPDNIVTRAEMAVIVVSALGLADYATGTAKFSDMAGHWSNGFVAYATSLGIIAGYPDGTFKPDKTVSYDEAATMLVAALGYTPDSLAGTWPTNYVSKAKVLGILDGIKAGAAGANRGDIAIMTFQTLDQNVGKTDKDGKWEATVLKYDTSVAPPAPIYDNMLDRLGAEVKAGGAFVLNATDAEAAVANVRDYIGAFVTAYVNDDGDIIAIKEVKSTFLTGTVKAANLGAAGSKFKADGVEYTVERADYDNKTVTPNLLNVVATEFDNTDDQAVAALSAFTPGTSLTIAAKVSGKYIKEIYSISEWTIKDHGFFSDDDADDIKDANELFGYAFVEDDNDNIDLKSFELRGADSLGDIAEDSVVYVYANAANEITRIDVGTEVVTGEVTRISGGDYTIDGKVYGFAGQVDPDNYTPSTKDIVKISLDYAGDIYLCEKEKGAADNYAVVLDIADGASGFSGNDMKINLFLADGSDKAFVVDEDEIAAGLMDLTVGKTRADKKWDTGAIGTGDIIKYSVDKDGVIDEILVQTAVNATGGAGSKLSDKGYYAGYAINKDAVMFTADTVTALTSSADDYGTTTLDKVLDSTGVKAYYVLSSGKIDAMLLEADVVAGDDVFGVAIDAAENNSDAGYEIEFLIEGAAKLYNAKATAYGKADTTAEIEDLFLLKFNTAGDVSDLTAQTPAIASLGVDVFSVSGRVVTLDNVGKLTTNTPTLANNDTFTLDSDVVVYVWNASDSCFEKGNIRDITATTASGTVRFFDVFDSDDVYDVVLVIK